MKNAALFAIGFLSVNSWLLDSARCQTSLAPPLSLARPTPSPDESTPPPAIIYASPPTATDDAPPPKATAKRSAPPVATRDAPPPTATDDAPPPKATAKRSAPPVAAREVPPPKPAADHDGFTTHVEDEPVAKLPVSPRAANRSKPKNEPDSIARGPWADSPEDEALRRKLTICRDCK
jgi:hypothetical protein